MGFWRGMFLGIGSVNAKCGVWKVEFGSGKFEVLNNINRLCNARCHAEVLEARVWG